MAFQPVPNAALVELLFNYNGQTVENTVWVQTDGPITEVGLGVIANVVKNWWIDNMRTQTSSDMQLVQLVATYKGDAEGPQHIETAGLPSPGAVPSEGLPNGTALVVKFGTASIGRSFRGRNYVPGLPSSAVVNSVYNPAPVADVVQAYEALGTALQGISLPHIVVSRFSGGVLRPAGISTLVTSYSVVTPSTRSQRRRNPGVGG